MLATMVHSTGSKGTREARIGVIIGDYWLPTVHLL